MNLNLRRNKLKRKLLQNQNKINSEKFSQIFHKEPNKMKSRNYPKQN